MTEIIAEASLQQSPGAILRSAREKAGVHLAVLSVNLKVSIKQLEALEADRFEHLPEPVFARALAAKVCRFLKIDSEPVLALMPQMTNGLKPLQLIESDTGASFKMHRMDLPSGTHHPGRKLWILFAAICFLIWLYSADWQLNIFHANTKPEVSEVVPTMPPVQEQVAPDSTQTDLPKAMVFDSSTPAPDANRRNTPTDSNPPTLEVKK
jgi:cytoskeleton protein RodZ